MGLGNRKTRGNQGDSHPWQHRELLVLGQMAASLVIGGGGLATEATMQLLLTALRNHQDFELKLVRDTGNSDKTVCEKSEYDETTDTYTYSYEDVGGAPYVPTGPLVYLDPDATLNLILAELTDMGLTLDGIETNTADNATETTLALINGKLAALGQKASAGSMPVVLSTEQEALIDGIEALLTTIDGDTSNLDVALSTIAKEATLLIIDTVLDNILVDTSILATPVTGLAVSLTRVTSAGAGSVTTGKRRVTFFNAGNTDATVAGTTLERGELVTFSADGLRDTLAAIAYNADTSVLLISTVG